MRPVETPERNEKAMDGDLDSQRQDGLWGLPGPGSRSLQVWSCSHPWGLPASLLQVLAQDPLLRAPGLW